jgi:hypothetical protein
MCILECMYKIDGVTKASKGNGDKVSQARR